MPKLKIRAIKNPLRPRLKSTLRNYIISTSVNLVHICLMTGLYTFGLMRLQAGLFFTRNAIEAYVTSHHTQMILSALPEFLIYPPWFIGFGLSYFYSFILYHEATRKTGLLAKQRRYTRYSLVMPFPHLLFVIFFTIDALIVYFADERGYIQYETSFYLIVLSAGSVCNLIWIICLAVFFPPFVRYRRDMVNAEKRLLRATRERLLNTKNPGRPEAKQRAELSFKQATT